MTLIRGSKGVPMLEEEMVYPSWYWKYQILSKIKKNKIDKNNQVFGSDLNKVSFITKKETLNLHALKKRTLK